MQHDPDYYESFEQGGHDQQVGTYVKLAIVMAMEGFAWLLHYAMYSETMTLMPGGYLIDIPGVGWMFGGSEDMTVNHLIAVFLAAASVATPVCGWLFLLRSRALSEPGMYFANPAHQVYALVLGLFWLLMLAVEIVNVLTLIQSYVDNPFVRTDAAKAFREHQGLALLSAVMIALVNAALGLATALIWNRILGDKEIA